MHAASTFIDILRDRSGRSPNARAFLLLGNGEEPTGELDNATLDLRARTIAAALQACDAVGQRVLLLYPFGLEYVEAFFGALYAGAIAVPVNPPDPRRLERTLPRLRAIVADARPTVVLTTQAILGLFDALVGQAPEFADLRWLATDALVTASCDEWRAPDATSTDIAFLQYTSGSTTRPKGVRVSHGNLMHNEELCRSSTQLDADTVFISWLPLYHDMGLIGGLLHPLYVGVPCVLMPPQAFLQQPGRWLRAIARYGGTISGGPNFAYDLCVRKVAPDERDTLDLSCWRYAFNGAEPVRWDTLDRFTRYFAASRFRPEAFRPLYGLAEATLMVSGSLVDTPPLRLRVDAAALQRGQVVAAAEGPATTLTGCGWTWQGQDIALVDPHSHVTCAPDVVGEIWVRGGSVAQGYWNRPELSASTFAGIRDPETRPEGPYLRTGDLGFAHSGQLFVTGRLKDLVLIRGRNHYPQDIERSVEDSHAAIRPGCGAAFTVSVGGEERLVIVQEVQRDRAGDDLDGVVRAVRRGVSEDHGLAVYAVALVREGSISKTSSGKIQRRACHDRFLAGALECVFEWRTDETFLASAAPPVPHHQLRAEIARLAQVPMVQLDAGQSLVQLGLDSLALVELEQVAARRFGLILAPGDQHVPIALLEARLVPDVGAPAPAAERPFTVRWDIATQAPALLADLATSAPWVLPMLAALRDEVPVPPTNDAFDDGRMFRPPGHFRAFYLRGPARAESGAVIAVKGADVACEDQRGFLQMLHQRAFERFAKFSVTNVLEYFLLQERKVPGALLVPEAIAEAERAAEVQGELLECFGELGALPVPLLVLSWNREVTDRFRSALLPLLGGFPRGIAEQEIERGIACYIYYFPRAPFPRVSHFAGTLSQEANRTGAAGIPNTRLVYTTLKSNLDPGAIVDGWLSLVARMLLCGYFPSDALHFKNGQCIEPQNVLLNGALADLDSVVPMATLGGDREFYANFLAMLNLLANTVRVFLIAENNGTTAAPSPFPAQFPKPDFLDILTVVHVWERLKVHLLALDAARPGRLEPRITELVASNLAFPLLFDKVLYALHYAGPQIPESVLHMLNITDVYGDIGHADRRPVARLGYHATLDVDAAAITTIPTSFLEQLQLPAERFVQDVMRGEAILLNIFETFLGRIGLIVIPIEDRAIYVDRARTLAAARMGLAEAQRRGAQTVALTGMIPSATNYGHDLLGAPGPRLTTGHATTAACFVMMVTRILREAGRSIEDEDLALLGLGSIGTAILTLLLTRLPHPRVLRLCELPGRMGHLERLQDTLLRECGYRGELDLVAVTEARAPDRVHAASLLLSATSTANVIDVNRLRPGALIVDDSAPHCFDPRQALRRFQQRRDILFTEAGAMRSDRAVREISDLRFSTGWDHKVRAALRLLHPQPDTIMGCVFSSILTERFDDVPAIIGTPTRAALDAHYARLVALGFEGASLYCQDHVLDPKLIEMFRSRFGG